MCLIHYTGIVVRLLHNEKAGHEPSADMYNEKRHEPSADMYNEKRHEPSADMYNEKRHEPSAVHTSYINL